MAIYKSDKFHIDIEEQDYPDADCKFMISLWHTPKEKDSRELIAVGLSDNMPMLQSTRNKGNVVESVTAPHAVPIPYGIEVDKFARIQAELDETKLELQRYEIKFNTDGVVKDQS
jgi:hypothetical protein